MAPETRSVRETIQALSVRLRFVRVCRGDWSRICTPAVTTGVNADTAVFLDPPYAAATGRDMGLYGEDSGSVAAAALAWCRENGDRMKIALCGYEGEHNELEASGWDVLYWKANGGYANQRREKSNQNARRERIWFSPKCRRPATLF